MGDGNCFFYTVIEGMKDTRQSTVTLDDMRNYLAEQANEDTLQYWILYRKEFLEMRRPIMTDSTAYKKKYYEWKEETALMEGVKTLEQLRVQMRKDEWWADEWAVRLLEKYLNIKIIIINKKGINTKGDKFFCGLTPNEPYVAEYYIITLFDGLHYELIAYQGKRAFTLEDIPNELKTLYNKTCPGVPIQ